MSVNINFECAKTERESDLMEAVQYFADMLCSAGVDTSHVVGKLNDLDITHSIVRR